MSGFSDVGMVRLSADTLEIDVAGEHIIKTGSDAVMSVPSSSYSILFITITVLLIVFLLSVVAIYVFSVKKIRRIGKELDSLEASNVRNSEAITALLTEKAQMIRQLLKQYDSPPDSEKGMSFLDYVDTLKSSVSSYQKAIDAFRSDDQFFHKLETALNSGRNNIMYTTRALLKESINEDDYNVLIGSLSNMTPSSIAFMMDIKPGTIRVKKSRIIEKIKNLPESVDKHELMKMLNI